MNVLRCQDLPAGRLAALLGPFGLRVEPGPAGAPVPGSYWGDEDRPPDGSRPGCVHYLDSRLGVTDGCDIVVVGTPKEEITAVAKERGTDLIVIGASGERAMHLLLGSTTRGVLHDAPCDVLSVHP